MSLLKKKRLSYQPPQPPILEHAAFHPLAKGSVLPEIEKKFPNTCGYTAYRLAQDKRTGRLLKVGVIFSGGQAAGGHNVIAGLFDGLKSIDQGSRLFGFLGGPSGLIENRFRELASHEIDGVRNQGGFDLIGSGRTKIETEEQLAKVASHVRDLDAIVIIGGDDSNTNAAVLAEYFIQNGISTRVIGVPKTIDGDLRSPDIEISFGFDSACKTYAELIGNIARDALSAKKYYHFIKLMGRSASHITLECALATHPNLALIGEEKRSLFQIVQDLVDLIIERKAQKKEYGIVLIPEGLIEFIPEMQQLISLLNEGVKELPEPQQTLFSSLPERIQKQLLMERDPHGNVQVSLIETELLLMELVNQQLKQKGVKCNALQHFFGYEGRACFPSNFDATYCMALGRLAALAIRDKLTGVVVAIKNLTRPVADWELKAVPIVQLMHLERRSGKEKPVIAKTLVDLKGSAFLSFAKKREKWRMQDDYQMPGPIQFFGDPELTDTRPISMSE